VEGELKTVMEEQNEPTPPQTTPKVVRTK